VCRNPEGFKAGEGRFPIAIGLQTTDGGHYNDLTIYGIKATYVKYDRASAQKLSFYDLELESCPKTYFANNPIKNIDITKLYCLSAV
jgi:hypothetical protein